MTESEDIEVQLQRIRSQRPRALVGEEEYVDEVVDEEQVDSGSDAGALMSSGFEAERERVLEAAGSEDREMFRSRRIADREDEYHSRRYRRTLSPQRADPFSTRQDSEARTYSDIMKETALAREKEGILQQLRSAPVEKSPQSRTWAVSTDERGESEWEEKADVSGKRPRWDEIANWETTPQRPSTSIPSSPSRSRSRWDETPVSVSSEGVATTPLMAPGGTVRGYDANIMTPLHRTPGALPATPQARAQLELDTRNAPLSDHDLDLVLPSEGYAIVEAPQNYVPITPSRKLISTPLAAEFRVPAEISMHLFPQDSAIAGTDDISSLLAKPEDLQYFGKLVDKTIVESQLSLDEIRERKVMRLLLKMKNGTPQMRKIALRQLTEKAREFGPALLFDKLLPLLMSPSLEDQERHLLVKVVDRILFRLDDLVRPYVHKILVVIEPLLIDADYTTRAEGRELISNLSKAAGLAQMIAALRPDIDHPDEYVRNTTARALAVVASALGIASMLPFVKAVCASTRSATARHTGVRVIQQIALLVGCGILPHLRGLVEAATPALEDQQVKVRCMAALALAALAEASAPYGIEAFETILKPLWKGILQHRGRTLAAFLKAIGFLIPLMDAEYASYYTREVLVVLVREFATSDDDMRRIVLRVVSQISATEGVTSSFLKDNVLNPFFKHFWMRRAALDRRLSRLVVETLVSLARKVGANSILQRIVKDLRDDSESFRHMVVDAIKLVIASSDLGMFLENSRLCELLVDGLLFAFQEQQQNDDMAVLDSFGAVLNAMAERARPFLPQIASTLLWRLNNKSALVRQQAADLVARVAPVMAACGEERLLGHLGQVLYEYLGEEYPEVLGSILGGLRGIVAVIGLARMTPPVKDLLPRLTPILKNRHEKVQENCVELVGRIADRAAEAVSPREWMRVCFELLDMLKAHRKSIRRAAINTFGYIAKAIGPHDVLAALLNNLRVQERQNRVCTTVAIAIVAEICAPFTVLPPLLNEYRVPELNVQNGVLKSISFLFEYIGELGRDYVYAVVPLLEDALMERDPVHRQTACAAVKHVALGVTGLGCEDGLLHLLNYVWPNVFEESPHVIMAAIEAIEALRFALGVPVLFKYVLQGLFHPARRVRHAFWRVYNILYLSGQDAMVPCFPSMREADSRLIRRELELML